MQCRVPELEGSIDQNRSTDMTPALEKMRQRCLEGRSAYVVDGLCA